MDKNIDLVLEGGGVRGIGLVGAISELEKDGYSVRRVAGTSAGAIVGSLAAAGCSAPKMVKIMQSLNYRKFRDETWLSRFGAPGKLASFLIENGLYKGDYLQKWIADELEACGIKTFGDLRLHSSEYGLLPKNQAYRLTIITADLSRGELVYLPWDYHKYGLNPDEQSIAVAVRTSMSIPFFYKPARLGGSTLVDGGMLSNFPINSFDEPDEAQPDWPTFGIKLAAKENANLVPRKITGPMSLISALLDTAINGHDQRHLNNPDTLARTMFVDVEDIRSINFDITNTQQERLLQNGQEAARKFLNTWNFADYKKKFKNS
ncbi:patatin-like phospholipase family protein [Candidatus Parcubacteria bacterium]|nr:patatin-like phospholipase family protein [Candidatus Parcubacteria bacterium]